MNKTEIYVNRVRHLTVKNLTRWGYDYFGTNWLLKNELKLTIDHMFSIHDGYIHNILPEYIANLGNLNLVSFKENNIKSCHSAFDKNELFKRCKLFNQFKWHELKLRKFTKFSMY